MNLSIIVVLLFLFFVLTGLPIAFSFAVSSLIYFLIGPQQNYTILVTRAFGGIDAFALMAVPFFIYAGDLMKEGGLSQSLIRFADRLVGKFKGGMGHVCILSSAFFGAISGSSGATVAAIGGIMIPEMEKRGYDKRYAVVLASASGFLGILIPPSVPLIIYGLNAQVSVADLFLATIIPGLIMTTFFMLVNYLNSTKYCNLVHEENTTKKKLVNQKSVWPALIMPGIILGGIYSGIFTPTEAGAVAVFYGILVSAFYYKELKIKNFLDITFRSGLTSSVILIIISFAAVFGWIMTTEQLPTLLRDSVTNITNNKYIILLILNVIYLILGTFMETVTAIVITTPMFLPLVTAVGVDPIHFGIIQQTNLCVGLITPPMSLNLLIGTKIGNVPIERTVKPLLPFLITSSVVMLIITYVPPLSTFLPNLFMR